MKVLVDGKVIDTTDYVSIHKDEYNELMKLKAQLNDSKADSIREAVHMVGSQTLNLTGIRYCERDALLEYAEQVRNK